MLMFGGESGEPQPCVPAAVAMLKWMMTPISSFCQSSWGVVGLGSGGVGHWSDATSVGHAWGVCQVIVCVWVFFGLDLLLITLCSFSISHHFFSFPILLFQAQWAQAMVDLGATYAVYVAKHGCGMERVWDEWERGAPEQK